MPATPPVTTPVTTPVLIVGSGPTGLTLACDLARRSIGVRIIDKSADFPRSSRAKGPNPRSLEILEDLGVVDRVLAAGSGPLPMRKYRNGQAIADTDPFESAHPTPDTPYAHGRIDRPVAIGGDPAGPPRGVRRAGGEPAPRRSPCWRAPTP